jgi:hypothetical protein
VIHCPTCATAIMPLAEQGKHIEMKSIAALMTIPATQLVLATAVYAGDGGDLMETGQEFIQALLFVLHAITALL